MSLPQPVDPSLPTSPNSPRRASFCNRFILLLVFGALVAAFYLTGLHKYFSWDEIKQRRDEWRIIADENLTSLSVVFVLFSIVLMSLSLPVGSILSIAAGALFDLWLGVGLIIVASAFGSTFAFLSSRYLFQDFVRRWFGRWMKLVDRGIERDGASYLFMLRLSPVVPFFALNATMGLTKISTRTFFWVSLIGMLPSCFLYVMVGTQMRRINRPEDVISTELVVLLSVLALSPLVFRWLFRKKTAAATALADDPTMNNG